LKKARPEKAHNLFFFKKEKFYQEKAHAFFSVFL